MIPEQLPLFYQFHFYLFGLIAIVAAITFVTRKSPVAAVLWLVVTMFCLAVEYVMLDAQFIGVMQVLVYAGAIMVVFLFVIMLLNLGHPSDDRRQGARARGEAAGAAFVGLVLLAEIGFLWRSGVPSTQVRGASRIRRLSQFAKYGVVGAVAKPLYQDYALAFELTSVLLLVAIAGAVVSSAVRREAQNAQLSHSALSAVLFTLSA